MATKWQGVPNPQTEGIQREDHAKIFQADQVSLVAEAAAHLWFLSG